MTLSELCNRPYRQAGLREKGKVFHAKDAKNKNAKHAEFKSTIFFFNFAQQLLENNRGHNA